LPVITDFKFHDTCLSSVELLLCSCAGLHGEFLIYSI